MREIEKQFDMLTSIIAHLTFSDIMQMPDSAIVTTSFANTVLPVVDEDDLPNIAFNLGSGAAMKPSFTKVLEQDLKRTKFYDQGITAMQRLCSADPDYKFDETNFSEVAASKLFELFFACHTRDVFMKMVGLASIVEGERKDAYGIIIGLG